MPMSQERICNIPTATIADWINENVSAAGRAYLVAHANMQDSEHYISYLSDILDHVATSELPLVRYLAAQNMFCEAFGRHAAAFRILCEQNNHEVEKIQNPPEYK